MTGANRPIESELVGVGNLILRESLAVPTYQRSYAWKPPLVEDLLRDLRFALERGNREYFLGAICIALAGNGAPQLVDGQQRLATVVMMLAAIRDYCSGSESERLQGLATRIDNGPGAEPARRNWLASSLTLSADDDNFFKSLVAAGGDAGEPEPANSSNERIQGAMALARETIARWLDSVEDPAETAERLCDFIFQDAKVIAITVGSEEEAFTVFEVMNDRGVAISITDLLKNHLYGLAADVNRPLVRHNWNAMRQTIVEAGNEDLLKRFVADCWASKHGPNPTPGVNLFSHIRSVINSEEDARELSAELRRAAGDFVAFRDPGHERWRDQGPRVAEAIHAFAVTSRASRVEKLRPLLLALVRSVEREDFASLLPVLVAGAIRDMVCRSDHAADLERTYQEVAQRVSAGDVVSPDDILDFATESFPSDDEFRGAFETAVVRNGPIARYMLQRLEEVMTEARETMVIRSTEFVNLEHVLPQNPGDNWAEFSPPEAARYCWRIGNLAILDRELNDQAGNMGFDEKRDFYGRSEITLTRSIAEVATWTPEEIDRRQAQLAEIAVRAWPLAFQA